MTGEASASYIAKSLYGTDDISTLTKRVCTDSLRLSSGGSVSRDIGTAVAVSKNLVENNSLSNKFGIEKLDHDYGYSGEDSVWNKQYHFDNLSAWLN